MKILIKNSLLVSLMLLFALPNSLSALSGFSRQTGKSCMACHSQNIPKLNSYGRDFAFSGYTIYDEEKYADSLIEGSDVPLGLLSVLNASVVLKARYVEEKPYVDTDPDEYKVGHGEVQVLEDSGLYIGGRVANNFGALLSIKSNPTDKSDVHYSGKLIFAYPTLSGYGGLSLLSTKENGIFSAMEGYNTGLNTPIAQFENAYASNAAQATGVANGPATSLQAYYGDTNFFITAGVTVPAQNGEGLDAGESMIPFARVSYAIPISGWDFMLGAYGLNGNAKASDQSLNGLAITAAANLVKVSKEAYGLDLELNGDLFSMSTMLSANYVIKNVVDSNSAILTSYNLKKTDNSAASIEVQINPITPLGFKIAYLEYKIMTLQQLRMNS